MHDPCTMAFNLKNPFTGNSLVTIWHHDPETDGSDDSCGYTFPKLTKEQRDVLKSIAWSEAYEPHFQKLPVKRIENVLHAECLMRAAVELVCRVLGVNASLEEVERWTIQFVHNPMDNFRSALCFLPGYHSNFKEDRKRDREQHAYDLFSGIASNILCDKRPWYRHPRWHFWHWEFQVHLWQDFRRWAFSRCCKCGKGFRWGQSVVGQWDEPPARRLECLRGERGIAHSDCAHASPNEQACFQP